MSDALSLLTAASLFIWRGTLTYEKALRALGEADTSVFARSRRPLEGDAGAVIRLFGKQMGRGSEVGQFVTDYMRYLRNLMIGSFG